MTDDFKGLHVSELCFSKMVMNQAHPVCMPLSQLQCIHLLVQSSRKATFPQASPKAGAEIEEGALVIPTPLLSTLPCGWELNRGCPVPEWGGHWKVLNNWPNSAQLQVWPCTLPASHQSSATALDLLGAIMGKRSAWNLLHHLAEIEGGHPSWHNRNTSSEETVFRRRKFVCCFF